MTQVIVLLKIICYTLKIMQSGIRIIEAKTELCIKTVPDLFSIRDLEGNNLSNLKNFILHQFRKNIIISFHIKDY